MTNDELAVSIAKVEERLDGLADDVREIKDALVGNGSRPGLVERVAVSEQRVTGVESRLTALESRPGREGTGLSTTKLLGIMAAMAGAITGLIEIIAKLV
jgi:hypothetical protein